MGKRLKMKHLMELWYRVKHNSLYLIFGYYSFFAGLVLQSSRRQFYYPPQFKSLMNSPIIDWSFIILGILMFVYSVSPIRNNRITGILIGGIAGLTAVTLGFEIEHFIFKGDFGLRTVYASTISLAIFWCARHRSKR